MGDLAEGRRELVLLRQAQLCAQCGDHIFTVNISRIMCKMASDGSGSM
jgi:hypothetical protein